MKVGTLWLKTHGPAINQAADLKDDEVELVLRCGIDMARFQSVWNRFENAAWPWMFFQKGAMKENR